MTISRTIFKAMAAAMMLAAMMLAACGNEDNIGGEPAGARTYTMTVEATLGDGGTTTRALGFGTDGKLNATWTEGDKVTVEEYIVDDGSGTSPAPDNYGTLTATDVRNGGRTCTLAGMVTGSFLKGQQLTLKYNGSSGVDGPKGTLRYVAKHDDRATATVTITNEPLHTGNKPIEATQALTLTPATFVNQQAIVCFTLKDTDGKTLLTPTQLKVKVGTLYTKTLKEITADTYTENGGNGVLYMAMPEFSGQTVTLEATLPDGGYRLYKKTGVTMENSKYYTVGVKMNKGTVDLAALTADYTVKNGDILYGTLSGNYKVSIASNAKVTLNGVTIEGLANKGYFEEGDEDLNWAGLTCKGDATITLIGTNTVNGFYESAGIYVASGKTLTIQGDGTLNAKGCGYGAGIGGSFKADCGNIEIKGGTVNVTGGKYSAGIGGGRCASCGTIKISGGTVTATGGAWGGSGIGTGNTTETYNISCGKITISGGTVTATGGAWGGSGIGSGDCGKDITNNCSSIEISGGTVTATGGSQGAGIGTGLRGTCGKITIKGGSGTATKGGKDKNVRSIGAGLNGTCGTVKVGSTEYSSGISTSPFSWSIE